MKKKYPDSRLCEEERKDILSIWCCYVLMIKSQKILVTLSRKTVGTLVLLITNIRGEALSHNSSPRFQEKTPKQLDFDICSKIVLKENVA